MIGHDSTRFGFMLSTFAEASRFQPQVPAARTDSDATYVLADCVAGQRPIPCDWAVDGLLLILLRRQPKDNIANNIVINHDI